MCHCSKAVADYLHSPEELLPTTITGKLSEEPGFFKFGEDLICYGKCSAFVSSRSYSSQLQDARQYTHSKQGVISLPFDVSEAIEALRREEYVPALSHSTREWRQYGVLRMGYYLVRPFLSRAARRFVQRSVLRGWRNQRFPRWPVDTSVEQMVESLLTLILLEKQDQAIPFIWFWPEGKQSCAIMTHDVETRAGRDFSAQLMDVDDSYGIKASFQVVPEGRYPVPRSYLESISQRGFEVNIQDLNHDGKLFDTYQEFQRRVKAINQYAQLLPARGFRGAVLYRNVNWLNSLSSFEYDMSVPNVAHLDPQIAGSELPKPVQGKTLAVLEVDDLFEPVSKFDGNVQTLGLGMADPEKERKLASLAGRRGVDRVVKLGRMHVFVPPWDGVDLIRPMVRMVRHVSSTD